MTPPHPAPTDGKEPQIWSPISGPGFQDGLAKSLAVEVLVVLCACTLDNLDFLS